MKSPKFKSQKESTFFISKREHKLYLKLKSKRNKVMLEYKPQIGKIWIPDKIKVYTYSWTS